jgi:hypothetical protein
MSRGNRIRLCAAQLKTNSQATFSSPGSLTCRKGRFASARQSPFNQPAAAHADGVPSRRVVLRSRLLLRLLSFLATCGFTLTSRAVRTKSLLPPLSPSAHHDV